MSFRMQNLEQAEKDRDRAENLYKKQAISKEKYERGADRL